LSRKVCRTQEPKNYNDPTNCHSIADLNAWEQLVLVRTVSLHNPTILVATQKGGISLWFVDSLPLIYSFTIATAFFLCFHAAAKLQGIPAVQ
jgi:hypothetical protein